MNKNTVINTLKNESGQVLLFAVVAMSIALAIGVAVSSRTLSNLSRTSRTDTSSRVYAAAEGGIEAYLNYSDKRLKELADALVSGDLDDTDMCGADAVEGSGTELGGCRVLYEFPGENIKAQAIVSVQEYKFNSNNNFLTFDLANNETKEVYLDGYANVLNVCWSDTTSSPANVRPDMYLIFYNSTGVIRKTLVQGWGVNSSFYTNRPNNITRVLSNSGGTTGYNRCADITPPASTYAMRVKALFDNAKVGVRPADTGSFPNQGFQIISKGELQQEDLTKSVRTVKVFKSLPYLPGVFDNAIYSEAPITD